ncbi:two component transcriptional regulator, LuxR family [Aliiroseovarius sediminilitoris]|uniref:Two component transcriptional regulator, LuxR family n=1 Tax=Aliiroseovarius sediminilitoris TaxID=1173584 RepID=A0A1I0QX96_9RHOB|nr:response regulator [Aliiroseovarius sediminilitoris]SEW32124.1 two component transcriptional regulator, LuxR family [Aliiroseovarius sediminilitoris]
MNKYVYLVDDDKAVRSALTLLLETVGLQVRSFASPEVFLNQTASLAPGCLVLDIRMPAISGLKLQEKLTDQGMTWPTVVISGHGDIEACRRAFRNGAIDFLSKPIDEQDLIDAIQKGHAELARQQQDLAERAEAVALVRHLSVRELEVLEMIAKGLTTKQIADALGLSPRTVESHRAAIAAKAGTSSAAELTRYWLEANADQ